MIPKSKLKKLKTDLKGQSLKDVADKLGKSEQSLYQVLSGKHYSQDTVEALIELRDKVKKEKQNLINRI